jgi:hypothetical protein
VCRLAVLLLVAVFYALSSLHFVLPPNHLLVENPFRGCKRGVQLLMAPPRQAEGAGEGGLGAGEGGLEGEARNVVERNLQLSVDTATDATADPIRYYHFQGLYLPATAYPSER